MISFNLHWERRPNVFRAGSLRCAELLPQGINLKILGVIPARGGSKSIPRKNLSDVHGRPLLSFIVEAAKNTRTLDRVILTTEDEEIAAVGRKWGAETPFMRPAELAEDEVGLVPVAQHAMRAMDEFGYPSDIVVSIQATSPFIEAKDIDRVVDKLLETDADSAASVEPIAHEGIVKLSW